VAFLGPLESGLYRRIRADPPTSVGRSRVFLRH